MKLRSAADGSVLLFWCPACRYAHPYQVKPQSPGHPTVWTWNGDMERPTFSPSLLVYGGESTPRCHLFLRDGRLEYCGDSQHELAGKTVDLPDWPEAAP